MALEEEAGLEAWDGVDETKAKAAISYRSSEIETPMPLLLDDAQFGWANR